MWQDYGRLSWCGAHVPVRLASSPCCRLTCRHMLGQRTALSSEQVRWLLRSAHKPDRCMLVGGNLRGSSSTRPMTSSTNCSTLALGGLPFMRMWALKRTASCTVV